MIHYYNQWYRVKRCYNDAIYCLGTTTTKNNMSSGLCKCRCKNKATCRHTCCKRHVSTPKKAVANGIRKLVNHMEKDGGELIGPDVMNSVRKLGRDLGVELEPFFIDDDDDDEEAKTERERKTNDKDNAGKNDGKTGKNDDKTDKNDGKTGKKSSTGSDVLNGMFQQNRLEHGLSGVPKVTTTVDVWKVLNLLYVASELKGEGGDMRMAFEAILRKMQPVVIRNLVRDRSGDSEADWTKFIRLVVAKIGTRADDAIKLASKQFKKLKLKPGETVAEYHDRCEALRTTFEYIMTQVGKEFEPKKYVKRWISGLPDNMRPFIRAVTDADESDIDNVLSRTMLYEEEIKQSKPTSPAEMGGEALDVQQVQEHRGFGIRCWGCSGAHPYSSCPTKAPCGHCGDMRHPSAKCRLRKTGQQGNGAGRRDYRRDHRRDNERRRDVPRRDDRHDNQRRDNDRREDRKRGRSRSRERQNRPRPNGAGAGR